MLTTYPDRGQVAAPSLEREVKIAAGRLGAARRYGRSPEQIRQCEQDLAAAQLFKLITEAMRDAPPLRPEHIDRAVLAIRGVS